MSLREDDKISSAQVIRMILESGRFAEAKISRVMAQPSCSDAISSC